MADAVYEDPRLAGLYDAFNPWGRDTDFYVALAGPVPRRILDIGCGTGLLAAALAERGHDVAGVDPACAMLDVARRRPGGDKADWVQGLAADAPPGPYDLVAMTGHAFQVLLDDSAISDLFAQVRRRLTSGGAFAFETRNPVMQAWRHWTPEASRRSIQIDGQGHVEAWHQATEPAGETVAFESFYRFETGETLTSRGVLRFPRQPQIDALLRQAGFTKVDWLGDWDGGPLLEDSEELIAIAYA